LENGAPRRRYSTGIIARAVAIAAMLDGSGAGTASAWIGPRVVCSAVGPSS